MSLRFLLASAIVILAATSVAAIEPQFSLGPATTREGDEHVKTVMVYLTMREDLGGTFSLRLFSSPITANQFLDFQRVDTTVTFRTGQTKVGVPITIYGDNLHEADETFRLVLEGTGFSAIFTIVDDDEPNSLPGVSIDPADVIEGSGTPTLMRFRVALTAPSFDGVSVRYETVERSAAGDEDFVSQASILRFLPGELVKWIEIEINDDDEHEWYWEFFDVQLLDADGANIERSFAFGRIRDDDTNDVRWLKVHDAVAIEGSTAIFRLELSRPADQPITIRWAAAETVEHSVPKASSRGDFWQQISAVTFQPGETLIEIPVRVHADAEVEKDEYFGLFVAPSSTAIEFDPQPGTGIIIDDDRDWAWPLLRVEDLRAVEGDFWTELSVRLRLSRASETEASVVVKTREPGGLDFEDLSTTVTFAPGETEKTVVLRIRGDDIAEPLELVNLDFREPSGLSVGRDFIVLTILDDDRPARDRAVRH